MLGPSRAHALRQRVHSSIHVFEQLNDAGGVFEGLIDCCLHALLLLGNALGPFAATLVGGSLLASFTALLRSVAFLPVSIFQTRYISERTFTMLVISRTARSRPHLSRLHHLPSYVDYAFNLVSRDL